MIPNWFVILMGLGTIFIGSICIVILCKILGALCTIADTKNIQPQVAAPTPAPVPVPMQSPVNRQEVIAAIGVAIAEELGVDVNAIRITSIKKI